MPQSFCQHLQDYADLYQRAEEAYRACNDGLDQVLGDGPDRAGLDRLTAALEAWLERDRLLREGLVELVRDGRVRIPKKKAGRSRSRKSVPICAECGFRIPRLEMSEWRVAANGEVAYRGHDLSGEVAAASGAEKVGA